MAGGGELVSLPSGRPEPAAAVCAPMSLLKWDLTRWGRGSRVGVLLDEMSAKQQGEQALTSSHAFFNNSKTFKIHDDQTLSRLHEAMAFDFKNLKANCIIERCDTALIRLFLDLDIEHETVNYEVVRDTWLSPIVSAILQCTGLQECVMGVAIAPPKVKNGKTKTGVHLNFPDILLPLREVVEEGGSIRPFQVIVEAVKHMLDKHSGISDLDWNMVVDSSLYHEKKGLRMLFQSKLENCGKCDNKWKELNNGSFLCTEKNKSWSRCTCSSHAAFSSWKASELGKVDHCPPLHACDGLRLWSVNRLYVPVDMLSCTLEQSGTESLAVCVRDIPLILRSLPFGESLDQWIRADVFDLESVIEFFSIRNVDSAAKATIEYRECANLPEWIKTFVTVQTNATGGRNTNKGHAINRFPRTQNVEVDARLASFFEDFFSKYNDIISKELNADHPLGIRRLVMVESETGGKVVHYSSNHADPVSKFCALKGVSHHSNRNYFQVECRSERNTTKIYLTHKCYSERCRFQEKKFIVVLKAYTSQRDVCGTCMQVDGKKTIYIEASEIASIKNYLQAGGSTAVQDMVVQQNNADENDEHTQARTQNEGSVIHPRASYETTADWAINNHDIQQRSALNAMIQRYQSMWGFGDLYDQIIPKKKGPGRPKKKARLTSNESESHDETETVTGENAPEEDDENDITYREFINTRTRPEFDPSDKEIDAHVKKVKNFWSFRTNYKMINQEPFKLVGFGFPDAIFADNLKSVGATEDVQGQEKFWLKSFYERRNLSSDANTYDIKPMRRPQ